MEIFRHGRIKIGSEHEMEDVVLKYEGVDVSEQTGSGFPCSDFPPLLHGSNVCIHNIEKLTPLLVLCSSAPYVVVYCSYTSGK